MGEDLDALYVDLCRAFSDTRPHALIIKRPMAPGIAGAEGSPHAHEVLKTETAIEYLEAARRLRAGDRDAQGGQPDKSPLTYSGSSGVGKNRDDFGKIINEILDGMSESQRIASVKVFDNDLEGSCGLHHIRKKHPEVFVRGGIMERGNYSAAAGFGAEPGKQGIFATFSAFLEMCISEITMARLNFSNVLAHFSHSGVDDMADNTCHFGINSMYADGGVDAGAWRGHDPAVLPGRPASVRRLREAHLQRSGLRFVFTTRAPVPDILGRGRQAALSGQAVRARQGRHRARSAGRAAATSSRSARRSTARSMRSSGCRKQGVKVGLINKPTLNVVDRGHDAAARGRALRARRGGWNVKTGLGSRFGSYLLQAGFKGRYDHIGTNREGCGGLWQQMGYQGLDPAGITAGRPGFALIELEPRVNPAPWVNPCNTDENDYHLTSDPHHRIREKSCDRAKFRCLLGQQRCESQSGRRIPGAVSALGIGSGRRARC